MRLLVAGHSVRHIACSAAMAGHDVIAADCFCDLDLERCVSTCIKLEEGSAESTVRNCARIFSPDAVILGPGLEEMKLSGIYTALVTPFNRDESVDVESLEELVEFQIREGIDGLVPMGTTGESPTLSHEEHNRVIELVISQVAGRVPVIAGTGSNSTAEAIRMTRRAKENGADASLQASLQQPLFR